jgi:hypothetical protein
MVGRFPITSLLALGLLSYHHCNVDARFAPSIRPLLVRGGSDDPYDPYAAGMEMPPEPFQDRIDAWKKHQQVRCSCCFIVFCFCFEVKK